MREPRHDSSRGPHTAWSVGVPRGPHRGLPRTYDPSPGYRRAHDDNSERASTTKLHRSFLEQIPQELVVDLVVELHFLRLDESPQRARAAIGRSLFQVRIARLHVFAEKL